MYGKKFASYHPGVLLTYYLLVLGVSMFTLHPVLLLLGFAGASGYVTAFCGWNAYRKRIPLILALLLITTGGNMILSHDGELVFFYAYGNRITAEAMLYGLSMGVVIATVFLWFVCMSQVVTTDKILYLFGGIFPAVTLTVCMMLRYIPMLRERYRVIHQAQCAMGRKDRKIRQSAKEFSILVSWSLENAIDTADAMESRGYGMMRRTQFSLYHFTGRDVLGLTAILILGLLAAGAVFWHPAKAYYYPTILLPAPDWKIGCLYLGYAALMMYPALVEIREGRKWK